MSELEAVEQPASGQQELREQIALELSGLHSHALYGRQCGDCEYRLSRILALLAPSPATGKEHDAIQWVRRLASEAEVFCPEIVAEDGGIGLDWGVWGGGSRVLSLSFGGDGTVNYAGLWDGETMHGRATVAEAWETLLPWMRRDFVGASSPASPQPLLECAVCKTNGAYDFLTVCDACAGSIPDPNASPASQQDTQRLPPESQAELDAYAERLRATLAPRQAALTSLIQRVREFVGKFGYNDSKTGRREYTRSISLSEIEILRVAFNEFARFDAAMGATSQEEAP